MSPMSKPILVWIIGFLRSRSEVFAREKVRISEGFSGLWKISSEKFIDPNTFGYKFVDKDV